MTRNNRTNIAILVSALAYIPVLLTIDSVFHDVDPSLGRAVLMVPAVLVFGASVMSVLYACKNLSFKVRMNIIFAVQLVLMSLGLLDRTRSPDGMGVMGDFLLILMITFAASRMVSRESESDSDPGPSDPQARIERERDRLRAGIISLTAGVILGGVGAAIVMANPMFMVVVVFGGWIPIAALLVLGVGLIGENLLRRARIR